MGMGLRNHSANRYAADPPCSAFCPIRGGRRRDPGRRVFAAKRPRGDADNASRGAGRLSASFSGPRGALLAAPGFSAVSKALDWAQPWALEPIVRFGSHPPSPMGVFCRGLVGLACKLRAPGKRSVRFVTHLRGDSLQDNPTKKARVGQEEPSTPPSSPLSQEQLVRIQKNKAAALLRLAARNVPVGFGESWKKHLSGEFGKPYFIKVNVESCF